MYQILNYTHHDIVVYRMRDVFPNRGDYVLRDEGAVPLVVIPSRGIARTSYTETTVGRITNIPLVALEYSEVVGLPDPAPGIYYVVSTMTARAAAMHGRTTHDLLLTARLVRDNGGRIIGCCAFSQFNPGHSRKTTDKARA